jgi:hypothetical protein
VVSNLSDELPRDVVEGKPRLRLPQPRHSVRVLLLHTTTNSMLGYFRGAYRPRPNQNLEKIYYGLVLVSHNGVDNPVVMSIKYLDAVVVPECGILFQLDPQFVSVGGGFGSRRSGVADGFAGAARSGVGEGRGQLAAGWGAAAARGRDPGEGSGLAQHAAGRGEVAILQPREVAQRPAVVVVVVVVVVALRLVAARPRVRRRPLGLAWSGRCSGVRGLAGRGDVEILLRGRHPGDESLAGRQSIRLRVPARGDHKRRERRRARQLRRQLLVIADPVERQLLRRRRGHLRKQPQRIHPCGWMDRSIDRSISTSKKSNPPPLPHAIPPNSLTPSLKNWYIH